MPCPRTSRHSHLRRYVALGRHGAFPLSLLQEVIKQPLAPMDPRITAQVVTLNPANPGEQKLCQLVIQETGAYLHREPLCPLKDSAGNLRTGEWLQRYCRHTMECLLLQLNRLERRFTGLSALVLISQAWQDWQARHEALETLHQCANPVYVAALDELLNDLHAPTSEGDRNPAALEDYYVSILVGLSFYQRLSDIMSMQNTLC